MIFSVGLPTCMEGMMYPIPFASVDEVIEIAQWAEILGYHSVWGNDHMTTQQYVRQKYTAPPNFWEPLITYSYIAACTTKLVFGTGLLVLPVRRDIVVTAKQIATFDHFSRGRLILSVGIGAYREEFKSLHPNWKANRGEILDESLQALRILFSERNASWKGNYFEFQDVEMYPKPLQNPLPIYIGGNKINAARRAASYGQGWMPAGMPSERIAEHVKSINEIRSTLPGASEHFEIAPQYVCNIDKTHEAAIQRFRQSQLYEHWISLKASTLKDQAGTDNLRINLIGTSDEVIEKIEKYKEAGVTHICGTYFCADSVTELKEQMHRFAEDVVAKFD